MRVFARSGPLHYYHKALDGAGLIGPSRYPRARKTSKIYHYGTYCLRCRPHAVALTTRSGPGCWRGLDIYVSEVERGWDVRQANSSMMTTFEMPRASPNRLAMPHLSFLGRCT